MLLEDNLDASVNQLDIIFSLQSGNAQTMQKKGAVP